MPDTPQKKAKEKTRTQASTETFKEPTEKALKAAERLTTLSHGVKKEEKTATPTSTRKYKKPSAKFLKAAERLTTLEVVKK